MTRYLPHAVVALILVTLAWVVGYQQGWESAVRGQVIVTGE